MNFKLRGAIGKALLTRLAKTFGPPSIDWEAVDPNSTSGLKRYFGADRLADFKGKRVLDFGCGRGADAVAAALAGATDVVGVDVQAHHLASARALAERHGVSRTCRFVDARLEPETYAALGQSFDVVFTIDAFEHFDYPAAMLDEIIRLLAPGGKVVISFGPPWKHPFGAHLSGWISLPWIHFAFDERTVLAVRSQFLTDGARKYEDVPGGLNRMTVESFEQLISSSSLRFEMFDPVSIRPLRMLSKLPGFREYTTSVVRAVCVRA